MISKEAVDEFKKIWKKEYGTEISDAEALKRGTNLLRLYKAVYKPITKEDYDKYHGEERVNKAFDVLFSETEKNRGK